MKIEIWSDFACPFCYIGKTKFEQALNEFKHKDGVEVIYKAYQLNPQSPKVMQGDSTEVFAKGHNMTVEQTKERFKMIEQSAKDVGLNFRLNHIQMTNTFDAHRLAKYAQTKNLEDHLTTRLMKAYFVENKNLADHQVLARLANEVGLDKDEVKNVLSSSTYEKEVKAQIDEARKVGVQGVPFFVINRKYGVSGAQQKEYFAQALEQIWKEEQPLKTLDAQDESQSCEEDGCGI